MKAPKEMTNDELALHLEMFANFGDLNQNQIDYLLEIVWRLRLQGGYN